MISLTNKVARIFQGRGRGQRVGFLLSRPGLDASLTQDWVKPGPSHRGPSAGQEGSRQHLATPDGVELRRVCEPYIANSLPGAERLAVGKLGPHPQPRRLVFLARNFLNKLLGDAAAELSFPWRARTWNCMGGAACPKVQRTAERTTHRRTERREQATRAEPASRARARRRERADQEREDGTASRRAGRRTGASQAKPRARRSRETGEARSKHNNGPSDDRHASEQQRGETFFFSFLEDWEEKNLFHPYHRCLACSVRLVGFVLLAGFCRPLRLRPLGLRWMALEIACVCASKVTPRRIGTNRNRETANRQRLVLDRCDADVTCLYSVEVDLAVKFI